MASFTIQDGPKCHYRLALFGFTLKSWYCRIFIKKKDFGSSFIYKLVL